MPAQLRFIRTLSHCYAIYRAPQLSLDPHLPSRPGGREVWRAVVRYVAPFRSTEGPKLVLFMLLRPILQWHGYMHPGKRYLSARNPMPCPSPTISRPTSSRSSGPPVTCSMWRFPFGDPAGTVIPRCPRYSWRTTYLRTLPVLLLPSNLVTTLVHMPSYCLQDCHYFYRTALRGLSIATLIAPLFS